MTNRKTLASLSLGLAVFSLTCCASAVPSAPAEPMAAQTEPALDLPTFPTIPLVKGMRVSSAEVPAAGGKIELTLRVESNVPVIAVELALDGPSGRVRRSRIPVKFALVKPELWEGTVAVELEEALPAGAYAVNELLAVNTGGTSLIAYPGLLATAATIHKLPPQP